jgi:hypothetical protein
VQDKYVGDIGDFGKYLLLKTIHKISGEKIRLGVNWYRVNEDNNKNNDGKFIEYLENDCSKANLYRVCDLILYNQLKSIVDKNLRFILEVEKQSLLPDSTIFYSKPLPFPSSSIIQREKDREDWFLESLEMMKSAEIIFLDPDNGLQPKSVKRTQSRANKYVFRDEIQRYYEIGKSVIFYTHRDRTKKLDYKEKLLSCASFLGDSNVLKILQFKRHSVRHYVFLTQNGHKDLIDQTAQCLTSSPYDFLFKQF